MEPTNWKLVLLILLLRKYCSMIQLSLTIVPFRKSCNDTWLKALWQLGCRTIRFAFFSLSLIVQRCFRLVGTIVSDIILYFIFKQYNFRNVSSILNTHKWKYIAKCSPKLFHETLFQLLPKLSQPISLKRSVKKIKWSSKIAKPSACTDKPSGHVASTSRHRYF